MLGNLKIIEKISKKNFVIFLLTCLIILTMLSFYRPIDSQVWWTEMTSVFVVLAICLLTYRKFCFSKTAYFILFLWCVLQIIGAHYTFEKVPFSFITNLFDFQRNNYDRLAHFTIGLSSFLIAEFVFYQKRVSSISMAVVFGIVSIMALANAWELVEWIYAVVVGGSAGQAFLGSQGDIWDAQKDMLADTLGSLVGVILFILMVKKKQGNVSLKQRKSYHKKVNNRLMLL